MPWSMNDLPPAAKNLSSKQKEIFVEVANSVLEETGDEERAIRSGLSRAKQMTEKSMSKKSLGEFLEEQIEKYFGGSQRDSEDKQENVAKALDSDKRLFTAVVLRPDVPDAHGDIYDEETVEKACHDFYQFCGKANLQHLVEFEDITFVENWIAKEDTQLGDGMIHKGDWVATAKINNDEVWEMCKDGTFTGFSVGCLATTEMIND